MSSSVSAFVDQGDNQLYAKASLSLKIQYLVNYPTLCCKLFDDIILLSIDIFDRPNGTIFSSKSLQQRPIGLLDRLNDDIIFSQLLYKR